MNDTHSHGTRMSTIDCQACVVRPSCSLKLALNDGHFILNPDMDYCQTRPEPFVAKLQLTTSLQNVFESLAPPSAEFNLVQYSHSEVRKSVFTGVRMELAELPEVHNMDFDKFKEVAEPTSHYYASIPPSTSKTLERYMRTKRALCLALLSVTISLISFSINFTLFRRQWKQFVTHPQRFLRGTHGRYLNIVYELAQTNFQRYPNLPKKYSHAAKFPIVPLATHPKNNPKFTPMSLTHNLLLMLDHRIPLPFQ